MKSTHPTFLRIQPTRRIPWGLLVLLSTVAFSAIGWHHFEREQTEVYRTAKETLSAIANLKAGQIENWMEQQRNNAELSINHPHACHFLADPTNEKARRKILDWMNNMQRIYGYSQVVLLDADGAVQLSVPTDAPQPDARCLAPIQTVIHTTTPRVVDLHTYQEDLPPHVSILAPISLTQKPEQPAAGVLLFVVDPQKFLFPLIHDWPTPSRTAEICLVRRENKEVVFLNHPHHQTNTHLTMRRPASDTHLPAALATQGIEGVVEGKDYRGVPVLAALRKISGTPWFIIAKVDQTEMYAPLYHQAWTTTSISGLLLLCTLMGIVILWRKQKLEEAQLDLKIRTKEERQLRISEERWKFALEGAGDGVWDMEIPTQKVHFSKQWEEMLGYAENELSQTFKQWADLLHPDDRARTLANFHAYLDGQTTAYVTEFRMRCKDNSYKWILDRGMVVSRDADGQPIRIVGTHSDITERKQTEDALRESEATVRKKLADILDPTGDIDSLELSDIMDAELLQPLFAHFYRLTGIPGAIADMTGTILVSIGAQDICTNFHRRHTDSCRNCVEKDSRLIQNVPPGSFQRYQCKNNMGGMVTPLITRGQQVGNIFIGQFFYKDEVPDIASFRAQAQTFGFNETEYLAAFDRAPHLSQETVEIGLKFYADIAQIISSLSLSAIQQSRLLTERQQAETALRQSEEKLRLIIDTSPIGICTTDTKGNYIITNRVFEQMLGYTKDELSKLDFFAVTHSDDRLDSKKRLQRVLDLKLAGYTVEKKYVRKDGSLIDVSVSATGIHDAEGLVDFGTAFISDITETKKNIALAQRTQKLESLGLLAGGIAHDFNNVLGGIYGYIELALMETTETRISSYLENSANSIDRARALTLQLLTFSKGGAPIKTTDHLFPFVQETTQFALSGSSVSSRFNIPDHLWPCNFDKNQLGQVIENFVINAHQAMPNGGMIEVSAQNLALGADEHPLLTAGPYVKLSITDQGIGIPVALLPRIFDPYYTTKPKGHGLGLATCYSIIKQHGGCIDVESQPDQGSTFHLYLPASTTAIVPRAATSNERHRGHGTFLVMDDDPNLGMTLKIMIESMGYTVVVKEDGKTAVDFFTTEKQADRPIAAMIFDLTVPGGMGGEEAIREIRKLCTKTPAFVSSGYAENPIMAHPEGYGFTASLRKPSRLTELSELFKKHIKDPG